MSTVHSCAPPRWGHTSTGPFEITTTSKEGHSQRHDDVKIAIRTALELSRRRSQQCCARSAQQQRSYVRLQRLVRSSAERGALPALFLRRHGAGAVNRRACFADLPWADKIGIEMVLALPVAYSNDKGGFDAEVLTVAYSSDQGEIDAVF